MVSRNTEASTSMNEQRDLIRAIVALQQQQQKSHETLKDEEKAVSSGRGSSGCRESDSLFSGARVRSVASKPDENATPALEPSGGVHTNLPGCGNPDTTPTESSRIELPTDSSGIATPTTTISSMTASILSKLDELGLPTSPNFSQPSMLATAAMTQVKIDQTPVDMSDQVRIRSVTSDLEGPDPRVRNPDASRAQVQSSEVNQISGPLSDPSIDEKPSSDHSNRSSPEQRNDLQGNVRGQPEKETELRLFLLKPIVKDFFDKIELTWSLQNTNLHRLAIRKYVDKNEQDGLPSVLDMLETLYAHEHEVVEKELSGSSHGSSILSLKRTRTDIQHRDILFKGVPGLQFVVEREVSQRVPLKFETSKPVLSPILSPVEIWARRRTTVGCLSKSLLTTYVLFD